MSVELRVLHGGSLTPAAAPAVLAELDDLAPELMACAALTAAADAFMIDLFADVQPAELERIGLLLDGEPGAAVVPLQFLVRPDRSFAVPAEARYVGLLVFATAEDLMRAVDRMPGGFGFGAGAEAAPAEDVEALPPADDVLFGEHAAPRVHANVDAAVASTIPVAARETVTVRLSRGELAPPEGAEHDEAGIRVDPSRPVRVSIAVRGLRIPRGARRVRWLELPASPDEHAECRFTVIGVDPGAAEVIVVVRQDPELPLATLALHPRVVRRGATARTARVSAHADAVDPDADIAALPTIRIDEDAAGGRSRLRIAVTIDGHSETNELTLNDKPGFIRDEYTRIARILEDAKDRPHPRQAAIAGLQERGAGLFRRLLGPRAGALVWEAIDVLRDGPGLLVQTTGEFDIPWEIVHPTAPDAGPDADHPWFLAQAGLTRWVYGTALPVTHEFGRARARYLCPEYVDETLRLRHMPDERDFLEEQLGATSIDPATGAGLTSLLQDGFDLFHFAGHGVWSGTEQHSEQLMLLADFREADPPPDATFSDVQLQKALAEVVDAASAPLVFFNACGIGRLNLAAGTGGFPEVFLRGGAGAFVGCNWSVGDDPASDFATAFYRTLLGGGTIGEAARAARAAAADGDDLTDLAYVVYAHPLARLAA